MERLALLESRFDEAEEALTVAVQLQETAPMRLTVSDARTSLAILHLQRGDEGMAWRTFSPVLQDALETDCIGSLLLEPSSSRRQLIDLIPAQERARSGMQELLDRLAEWECADLPVKERQDSRMNTELYSLLSEREREVLACIAAGESNKQIARSLDLSPHTVKRHVANILAKLGCGTRGQAAAHVRAMH